jgi:cytochrome c oxidase assembly factor 4
MLPEGEKHGSSTEDEPDEWDLRIERGGCAQEHFKLQDCYMETKDWRKCKDEVDSVNDLADE